MLIIFHRLRKKAPARAKNSGYLLCSSDCPSNRIPTNESYIGGPAGEKILEAEAQAGRPLGEDCISVNIWTKPQTGEANKAVLYWIFGGGKQDSL